LGFSLIALGMLQVARAEPPLPSTPVFVPASDAAASNADGDAAGELAAWLERLVSSDPSTRKTAAASLDRASPSMVPAITERLAHLSQTADRTGMAAVIAETVKPRHVDRDEIAGRLPDGGFHPASDWWLLVTASPAPEREAWRDLVAILGLSRLLATIGTTPAVRELGSLFVTYGELLRSDLERQLVTMGDRALPGLIEMRRGESKEQRAWALKLLEALGKAIPGEAVQTGDDQRLAEVLLAYGRAREVDAARVILSFANSDRRQIREAARQAVLLLADSGFSAVRESYANMMNEKPPEAWGWETTARELFRIFDRVRLVDAYALMDEGLAAFRQHDPQKAAAAFDRALARDPAFEKRAEMAPGYLAFARALKKDDPSRAMENLRKAMRVDPSGSVARQAESELLVLQARDRSGHGIVDHGSLRRALELDPDNSDASAELLRIEAESKARSGRLAWYCFGALGAFLAVGGVVAVIAHGRRSTG
jgi:tetratricopeptide (TPR) repeat protein